MDRPGTIYWSDCRLDMEELTSKIALLHLSIQQYSPEGGATSDLVALEAQLCIFHHDVMHILNGGCQVDAQASAATVGRAPVSRLDELFRQIRAIDNTYLALLDKIEAGGVERQPGTRTKQDLIKVMIQLLERRIADHAKTLQQACPALDAQIGLIVDQRVEQVRVQLVQDAEKAAAGRVAEMASQLAEQVKAEVTKGLARLADDLEAQKAAQLALQAEVDVMKGKNAAREKADDQRMADLAASLNHLRDQVKDKDTEALSQLGVLHQAMEARRKSREEKMKVMRGELEGIKRKLYAFQGVGRSQAYREIGSVHVSVGEGALDKPGQAPGSDWFEALSQLDLAQPEANTKQAQGKEEQVLVQHHFDQLNTAVIRIMDATMAVQHQMTAKDDIDAHTRTAIRNLGTAKRDILSAIDAHVLALTANFDNKADKLDIVMLAFEQRLGAAGPSDMAVSVDKECGGGGDERKRGGVSGGPSGCVEQGKSVWSGTGVVELDLLRYRVSKAVQ